MNKDELKGALRNQLQNCAGWDGDEIANAREDALDYYFQRARGDEVLGRSAVVSGDVSAMVEANLAQMLDAFSSDRIAEFDPYDVEDEEQAQLESDTVQYFVMKQNNGFLELSQAIKDALLLRNGIVKVWVEEKTKVVNKTYYNATPEALAALTDVQGAEAKIVKYNEKTGEAVVRLSVDEKKFRAKALPLENFLYPKNWDSLDTQEMPFCAERHIDTRSDLIGFGFPKSKVDKLPAYRRLVNNVNAARNPQTFTPDTLAMDSSQEPIEWFECFVLMDSDGDGIAERRRICISSDFSEILSDEPVNLVQYAAGTAIVNPHRFLGVSLYDKLKQSQDVRTGLRRALLDNVNTTTKNRLAYIDGKVNVDDVGDGRPNGAIRVNRSVADVRQAIMPFAVPDTSANILANLESTARERAEMGGAALDLQTAQAQIGGDRMGSQGLDRAYSVMEQLAALYIKNIAASLIRSVFLLAHATLREYWDQPVPIRQSGKWASPVPTQWRERDCLTVKIGMSPGERTRKANALQTVLQSQLELAGQGMDDVLVNVEGFYKTLMDWCRISEIQNPEQYFVDPQSDEAKKAMQGKQQQAQKQEQLKKALMQQAIGLEQLKTSVDKYKHDSDLQFKYWAEVLGAEVEEAKIAGSATADLLKAKMNGRDRAQEASQNSAEKQTPADDSGEPSS